MNQVYVETTTVEVELFPDVLPVLKKLAQERVSVAVFTNGPTDGQTRKFLSLGLDRYIEKLFISENIGIAKPHAEAFNHVLSRLNCTREETMMVGDSLEYDVLGGKSAEINAVLLDRLERFPKYTGEKIKNLFDLMPMLTVKGKRVS